MSTSEPGMTVEEALAALREMRRPHESCEDTWYQCPAHPEGTSHTAYEDSTECTCGADRHNAALDAALPVIERELADLKRMAEAKPITDDDYDALVNALTRDEVVVGENIVTLALKAVTALRARVAELVIEREAQYEAQDILERAVERARRERDEARAALHDAHEALVEPIDLDAARALLREAGEALEQGVATLIEMDLRIEGEWGRCHNYEQMEAGDEWDPAIPKLRAALAKIREQVPEKEKE